MSIMARDSFYELMEMSGAYDDWADREGDDADTEDGEHRAMREEADRMARLEWRMEEDRRKREEEGEAHEIRDPNNAARFLYAGNAVFTLRSKKTGTRFTYKVSHKKGGDVSFVSLLTGSDNTRDYSYMGLLPDDKGEIRGIGRGKSCTSYDAPSAKAFRYFLDFIWGRNEGAGLEVWHEGRCGRCGRKLTVPESIETGLGPECADRV
jgi:hypothetical protein